MPTPVHLTTTGSRVIILKSGGSSNTEEVTSIIALPGALSIQGVSGFIIEPDELFALPGSLSISGVEATLAEGVNPSEPIVATAGQLSIAGIESYMVEPDTLFANVGTLSIQGVEASLLEPTGLIAIPGTLSIEGVEASIVEAAAYRSDTLAYQTRVEADGGEVVDLNYVDAWYQALDDQGMSSVTGFLGGPNLGVKKSGGIVETLYNLIDATNDATQNGTAGRPADTTDINAGARVLLGDAVNDYFNLDSQIDLLAGDGSLMWWQIVDPDDDGYWAGTQGSSANGVRCLNTTVQMRASGTFSSFSIPSSYQIKNRVMRSVTIVRDNTDEDTAYVQGVQVGGTVTNANTFLIPNLMDGVNRYMDSPLSTMCIFDTPLTTTQREALEAVGNAKNLLPNNFLQDDEFLVVIVPDIQSDIDAGGSKSQDQADWILANRITENIQLVGYLGDQANDGSDPLEHALAGSIIDTFLDDVPTLLSMGNHDFDDNASGGSARDTDNFVAEFPTTLFTGKTWWNGGFEDTLSAAAYYLFSHGGTDFIGVSLPFGPTQDEIDWINTLLGTTYPTRKAILFTHSYIDEDGAMSGTSGNDADIYGLGADVHVGTQIKSEVSDLRSNLQFIFNGHHIGGNGTARLSQDVSGEDQHAIYSNFQDQANDGDGYMGLLYINPVAGTARYLVYSPTLDQFKPDSEWEHKFVVNI